ncbi:DUF1656 domain-containing protein [Ruficoccus amylovorans]|uniref:DUF1656 domain-containing protein n=1 Tax=Ruficoccus amylovorans TaxID=1804625 RepID=A0A842HB50_9BACT|nr:DUF1656 domain-containing protein [Ruficoccus amylovorans]MBC2593615.1 DUF1656 domain-containing protein [Ruficoccus amylovorans]
MIMDLVERLSSVVPPQWRLPAEIDFLGFYLTPIFVVLPLGILLAGVTVWLVDRARLTRFIWHPPLFLFSLAIIYGVTLSLLFMPA